MKPSEAYIDTKSEYFIYSPSAAMKEVFFYPISLGYYFYLPGYSLYRNSFNSYLLMYIMEGECDLTLNGRPMHAVKGNFILLDCYQVHSYCSSTGWEAMWIHFDGPLAKKYYDIITSRLGNVFSVLDNERSLSVIREIADIYRVFSKKEVMKEALLDKYIHNILTDFLLYEPSENNVVKMSLQIQKCMAHMVEHFQDPISNEELAKIALVSPYYFIRIFKKETGATPHEYINNLRMANAKSLLRRTSLPIKDICFQSGFQSVSVFCVAFKKSEGITPTEFRMRRGIID